MTHTHNALGQPMGLSVGDWKPPARPDSAPIAGRYCRLERLQPALHADSLRACNDLDTENRLWTYLPYGPFATAADYRAWLDEVSRKSDPWLYAIIDLTTQEATGVAGYLRIDPPNGSIEVGHLAYSPRLQRTPAATEAMYLLMARAFELGYRRYEWKCDALNEPSRAAARRLGFTFEGIFRQATVVKGRNRDTAWHAILDREWPARRDAFQRWLAPTNFDARGRQQLRLSDLMAALPRE